ncbi:helix-turn-helix domain-containing protein [Actinopolymorpha alba]|uniref:helix-turn-helix domain-containing protein n=1 Tax=Actinopolymorpha alba TaxID=533267 RepID=UPI000382E9EC|nr:helix-turn-helix domain-containing protein [Actinopolymorpha alba]
MLLESGLLQPEVFDRYFTVQGFQPAADLRAYVSHYWVLRWRLPYNLTYTPTEVLPVPMVHAFFTARGAHAHGITDGALSYETAGAGAMAGIAFNPGGFAPFWGGRISQLRGARVDLTTVFPGADPGFCRDLLHQPEEHLVHTLDRLLHSRPVGRPGPQLELVADAVAAITRRDGPTTVSGLAAELFRSERTLQAAFAEYVGVGPKWLLRRQRLMRALGRTARTARPDWAGIAADLGYSSQTHLLNDFKNVVGVTPRVYIRQLHRLRSQIRRPDETGV